MKQYYFISSILSFLFFANACSSCNSDLYKVCPVEKPCSINQTNNEIIVYEVGPFEITLGECKYGITRCNDQGDVVTCEGFQAPINELCDAKDNDCDGFTDEEFDKDLDGFTTCNNDCDDEQYFINPERTEYCNSIDDNCNSLIDEDLVEECWTGPPATIFSDTSICKKGIKRCFNGYFSYCQNQIFASREVCNNLDDDCDGEIDEKEINGCWPISLAGECDFGDQICVNGETLCIDAVYPTAEICDGLDNDCDTQIDNGLARECWTVCGNGVEYCADGYWVSCTAPQPREEICDDLDNNCNGTVDEGCLCDLNDIQICIGNIVDRETGEDVFCGAGIQICEGNDWGICYFLEEQPEQCNNWDDDCDGIIDGMVEVCGEIDRAGIGICRSGTSTCAYGNWSSCGGAVAPRKEVCNNLDDDCDGEVDEGLEEHEKVDIVVAIDDSGSMCAIIDAITQGLSRWANLFRKTEHKFALVVFPGPTPTNGNALPYIVRTSPSLTDVDSFILALSFLECNSGGNEPSYDVVFDLASANDPAGIGRRPDAYPYIILIGDENAQTWIGRTEQDIAFFTNNCTIGSCIPGDKIEIFTILSSAFFSEWDQIVFFEQNRLINIVPANTPRYYNIFLSIFRNVCL